MFKLNDIQIITNGRYLIEGNKSLRLKGVSIDSRTIKKGELFIAIIGEKQDGHDYLDAAIAKGAVAVLVSKAVKLKKEVPSIWVKDTTKALSDIASFHRDRFSVPIIAITGSSGKTTTKEMIATILSKKYKILKNYKSFNNQYGVPLTLLQLRKKHEVVILEVGTNRPGDIAALAS
ncbi:MAG TPA: UDP-N-acetylmuramoyl-tripeptide--D-alanyl-D-alanine ligase, partial [Candidatus Omnitrophota bacterium]|nr:UDP-N-acetylmuramoyl-tripeptide--D-alanyl-D-alanine ligase [Candidatus Omnitrophota bacterium]